MKQKGKRILSLLLALVFVLSLSPVSYANGSAEAAQETETAAQETAGSNEQPQGSGASVENTQEVASAPAASGDAGGGEQMSQSAAAADSVAVQAAAPQEPAGDEIIEAPSSAAAAMSEPEGIGETPKTETAVAAMPTETGGSTSETQTGDETSGTEQAGETQKAESDSGSSEEENTTETAKIESSAGNPDSKTPAKTETPEAAGDEAKGKDDQADEKAIASAAPAEEKATVQAAEPVRSKAAAKGAPDSAPQSGTYDYSVTVTEGSVTKTESSDTLQVTGSGSVEIELSDSVTSSEKSIIFGDDSENEHSIIVTLKNVVVAAKEKIAGILVKANTKLTLLLSGGSANSVTGGENHAGIEVEWKKEQDENPQYASLTIDGEGTLNATGGSGSGGAGIGGSKGEQGVYGDITINGGTIHAEGTSNGAGIGSSNNPAAGSSHGSYKYVEDQWGTITINGGDITAKGDANGAGIGGGNHTSSGEIVINGGTVYAEGDSGIGSGLGSHNGADKGPGYYYADVTINGGNVTAYATNNMGAGIGGGMYGDAYVSITGGDVTASVNTNGKTYQGGAGIGGGYQGVAQVEISGGTVRATGGNGAAGIGNGALGADTTTKELDGSGHPTGTKEVRTGKPTIATRDSEVIITGGDVTAQGGVYGAGIGSGNASEWSKVTITGGTVTATGGLSDRNEMKGGAGIGSGTPSAPSKKEYEKETDVRITIGGDAKVTATGGWGASGIGSGAGNQTAQEINIGANTQIEAYSDGTKFAIDSRDKAASINVEGNILQATFVKPYKDGSMDQDPTGLKTIVVTNDMTGENTVLKWKSNTVGMQEGYRSFATTVSEAGSYTVYTDEASVGQGGGRYFGKGETEERDPARPLSEMTRYQAETGTLSDNYFLFPVKSVVVTKVVAAEGGLDKSEINTTCYFALWDREAGSYVQRDGKTWIESIDIVKGVPQARAIFADVNDSPEGGYGVWEVDQNGRNEGIIGMTFGSYELRLVRTLHGDTGDNDAEISDDNWTDYVSVINTYFPIPDPDPDPTPTPAPTPTQDPVGPFFPAEEIEEDDVPLALGSLSNQLGECFD